MGTRSRPRHAAQGRGRNWVDDHAQSMGAALAFYTIFSIAPLLLIVIAVAGMVFGEEAARGEIYAQLNGLLGNSGAARCRACWKASASRPTTCRRRCSAWACCSWPRPPSSPSCRTRSTASGARRSGRRRGLWSLVRARLLSFGMILGIGFLLIVSLAFSAAMRALSRWWDPESRSWATFSGVSELGLSLLL